MLSKDTSNRLILKEAINPLSHPISFMIWFILLGIEQLLNHAGSAETHNRRCSRFLKKSERGKKDLIFLMTPNAS